MLGLPVFICLLNIGSLAAACVRKLICTLNRVSRKKSPLKFIYDFSEISWIPGFTPAS